MGWTLASCRGGVTAAGFRARDGKCPGWGCGGGSAGIGSSWRGLVLRGCGILGGGFVLGHAGISGRSYSMG